MLLLLLIPFVYYYIQPFMLPLSGKRKVKQQQQHTHTHLSHKRTCTLFFFFPLFFETCFITQTYISHKQTHTHTHFVVNMSYYT
jgi:hypothetical protein